MAFSIVVINFSDELQWYIGDSKMKELIELLNKIGNKCATFDKNGNEISNKIGELTKEEAIEMGLDPDLHPYFLGGQ